MNQDEQNKEKNKGHNTPYWKRAHHDWRLWLGIGLMLAAITYYIITVDFAFRPVVKPEKSINNSH